MWFRESGGEFIVNPAWVVRAMSMACYFCEKVICRNGSCKVMRDHTAGTAIITGKVDGETKINVDRLVYFNYTQQFRTRILHTARIVKTFSDTVTDEKLEKIISQFFLKKGGELTLTVDEYQSAYVFSNANAPYLFCRKK